MTRPSSLVEIIRALTPFPGIGGTGGVCGGITGSLIASGLFFGSDDRMDYEAMNKTIMTAQKFMASFEEEIGQLYCADIIEKVIIGQRLNPGESEEAMATFTMLCPTRISTSPGFTLPRH